LEVPLGRAPAWSVVRAFEAEVQEELDRLATALEAWPDVPDMLLMAWISQGVNVNPNATHHDVRKVTPCAAQARNQPH